MPILADLAKPIRKKASSCFLTMSVMARPTQVNAPSKTEEGAAACSLSEGADGFAPDGVSPNICRIQSISANPFRAGDASAYEPSAKGAPRRSRACLARCVEQQLRLSNFLSYISQGSPLYMDKRRLDESAKNSQIHIMCLQCRVNFGVPGSESYVGLSSVTLTPGSHQARRFETSARRAR